MAALHFLVLETPLVHLVPGLLLVVQLLVDFVLEAPVELAHHVCVVLETQDLLLQLSSLAFLLLATLETKLYLFVQHTDTLLKLQLSLLEHFYSRQLLLNSLLGVSDLPLSALQERGLALDHTLNDYLLLRTLLLLYHNLFIQFLFLDSGLYHLFSFKLQLHCQKELTSWYVVCAVYTWVLNKSK